MRALALTLLALACADSRTLHRVRRCDASTAERRAQFVVDCAGAANPKSDEEGEDLVEQCQMTATDTFCPLEWHVWIRGEREMLRCSEVLDPLSVAKCAEVKR